MRVKRPLPTPSMWEPLTKGGYSCSMLHAGSGVKVAQFSRQGEHGGWSTTVSDPLRGHPQLRQWSPFTIRGEWNTKRTSFVCSGWEMCESLVLLRNCGTFSHPLLPCFLRRPSPCGLIWPFFSFFNSEMIPSEVMLLSCCDVDSIIYSMEQNDSFVNPWWWVDLLDVRRSVADQSSKYISSFQASSSKCRVTRSHSSLVLRPL